LAIGAKEGVGNWLGGGGSADLRGEFREGEEEIGGGQGTRGVVDSDEAVGVSWERLEAVAHGIGAGGAARDERHLLGKQSVVAGGGGKFVFASRRNDEDESRRDRQEGTHAVEEDWQVAEAREHLVGTEAGGCAASDDERVQGKIAVRI